MSRVRRLRGGALAGLTPRGEILDAARAEFTQHACGGTSVASNQDEYRS